jgi:hypothetical protein
MLTLSIDLSGWLADRVFRQVIEEAIEEGSHACSLPDRGFPLHMHGIDRGDLLPPRPGLRAKRKDISL